MWLARIALEDMPCIQTHSFNVILQSEDNDSQEQKGSFIHLQGRNINILNQGCTNPGCQVTMAT
jgi:hypothetical protein